LTKTIWVASWNFTRLLTLFYTKMSFNKTENHFSPYPRSEGDINLYTRLKIVIAGKTCKKLPAYGRKKACNPAGLRPVIKTVIFLQGCRARLLGKAAEQGCQARQLGKAAGQSCRARLLGKAAGKGCGARLPGNAAGKGCRARLPGKAAGQGCRARLPGNAAWQGCRAMLHGKGALCTTIVWQVTVLQWQVTILQWQDTKLQ
jgi:hypothetical protein